MLGQIRVTPRWEDYPVRRQGGRWWMGRWAGVVCPPGRALDRRSLGRGGFRSKLYNNK